MSEEPIVISLEELEEARRDPRVIETMKRVAKYRERLIDQGHCSMCLVVNCEHICNFKYHAHDYLDWGERCSVAGCEYEIEEAPWEAGDRALERDRWG